MGREYISELRPPMGLLFIPQVIYEDGGPLWNDIDMIRLCKSYQQASSSKQEKLHGGNDEFGTRSIFVHTLK
jgi:hypothetical protein